MDAQKNTLVLYFDPNHTPTQQKVRDCLIRLSPGSADRMDTLLNRGRVVLKRNADPDKDRRIVALLAETGAICRFEKAADNTVADEASKTLPARTMVCPKCKRAQKKAAECSHCGLIIDKFKTQIKHAKSATQVPQPPLNPVDKPSESRPRLWDPLKAQYGPSIEKALQWLKGNPVGGEKIQQWSKRIADAIFRCMVVFTVTLLLEIGLLYLARMVWFVYTSTTVGQVYLSKFGGDTNGIHYLLQSNMAMVGWQTSITVLVLCILFGIAAQWFHLIRFLYLPFGFLGHTLLWVLPLTGLSAWHLYQEGLTNQMGVSCALTILPVLLLLPACIQFAQTAVPEMGAVIRVSKDAAGGIDPHLKGLKDKMKSFLNDLLQS